MSETEMLDSIVTALEKLTLCVKQIDDKVAGLEHRTLNIEREAARLERKRHSYDPQSGR